MNYLGIDLHKRESQVAVVDHDGEIQREVRVADSQTEGIVSKRGNGYLRWILVQCARIQPFTTSKIRI